MWIENISQVPIDYTKFDAILADVKNNYVDLWHSEIKTLESEEYINN